MNPVAETLRRSAVALRAQAEAFEAQALAVEQAERARSDQSPHDGDDQLLTVKQAAAVLGVATDWLYRRSGTLPFARKLGPRTLRFSERGLRRYVESRRT